MYYSKCRERDLSKFLGSFSCPLKPRSANATRTGWSWYGLVNFIVFAFLTRETKKKLSLTLHTVSHLKTVKTSDKRCLLIQKEEEYNDLMFNLLFNRGIIIWVKSQPLFSTRKKSFHLSRSCSACLRIENGSLLYPWQKKIDGQSTMGLLTILNLSVYDCQYQSRCYQNIIHSKLAFYDLCLQRRCIDWYSAVMVRAKPSLFNLWTKDRHVDVNKYGEVSYRQ